MKRIIYMTLLTVSLFTTVVSCTEEQVAPKVENGGGAGIQGEV